MKNLLLAIGRVFASLWKLCWYGKAIVVIAWIVASYFVGAIIYAIVCHDFRPGVMP